MLHNSRPDMKTGKYVCTHCKRTTIYPLRSKTCTGQPIRSERKSGGTA